MSLDEFFDAVKVFGVAGIIASAVMSVGLYLWLSFALSTIFRKAGEAAWKGWVPLVNQWTLFRLAGKSGWWALVQVLVLVLAAGIVGGVGALVPAMNPFHPEAGVFGILLFSGVYFVAIIAVLALQIVMLIGVNRGFGFGAGMTVLGVFFFFIWASVVAWGRAVWRGAAPGPYVYEHTAAQAFGAPAFPGGLPPMPPAAGASVAPGGPVPPPPSGYAPAAPVPAPPAQGWPATPAAAPPAAAPVSPPAPPVPAAPVLPAAPVPAAAPPAPAVPAQGWPAAPAAPLVPATPVTPSAPAAEEANPFSPVAAETIVAEPAASAPESPVAAEPERDPWAPPAPPVTDEPVAPVATPVVAPVSGPPEATVVAGSDDDLDERTVIARRRTPDAPSWSLVLPDGVVVSLVTDAVVLGRNPVAPDEAPDAETLAVPDTTRTVSKTHALLRRDGEGWTLTDLGSTNGVFLFGADGGEVEVEGVVRVQGAFLLGDATLHLTEG